MLNLATVVRLALPSLLLLPQVLASSCVAFDSNFNLYVFGMGGKDYNLGPQSGWSGSSITGKAVASEGRPPFDGENTTCYLAQFFNAIYVLNGDKANPSDVAIYDATANSWSTQKTTPGTFSPTTATAILDHDTNVFYAYSGGHIFSADFGNLVSANATTIAWNDVGTPNFPTDNYKPLMGLAQNHIHFLNVPGSQPGTARVFVIHFSYFQPEIQDYPVRGSGSPFPVTDGHVESIFKPEGQGVQQEFFFVPTAGANTYVMNVERNSTTVLAGPTDKTASTFTAGVTSIVQLTSAGNIFFLPYDPAAAASAQAGAAWSKINVAGLPPPASGAVTSGTSTKGGASPTSGISTPNTNQSGATVGVSLNGSLLSLSVVLLATVLGCTL